MESLCKRLSIPWYDNIILEQPQEKPQITEQLRDDAQPSVRL